MRFRTDFTNATKGEVVAWMRDIKTGKLVGDGKGKTAYFSSIEDAEKACEEMNKRVAA